MLGIYDRLFDVAAHRIVRESRIESAHQSATPLRSQSEAVVRFLLPLAHGRYRRNVARYVLRMRITHDTL